MKKVLSILLLSGVVALSGCSSTATEGGAKAERNKPAKVECQSTGSRIKKTC